jgi:hypothetical protein
MAHQVVNSKIGSKACFIGGGRRGAPWRFARFIHEAVSGYVIIFEKGFSFATSNTKEA